MGIAIIDDYGYFHDGKILQITIDKELCRIEILLKDVNIDWEGIDGYIAESGKLVFKEVTSYSITMQTKNDWNWITSMQVHKMEKGYKVEIYAPDNQIHFITIEFSDLELIPIGKESFLFRPPKC